MRNKILFFITLILILFFSLTPENMFDKKIFMNSDKIKHILAFFTICLFMNLNKRKNIKIIILIFFAATLEIIQSFIGRQASVIDFLFSCIGIFLFISVEKLFKKI